MTAMAAKAVDLGCHLLMGSLVERRGGALHNTSVLLGPDGRTLGTYRKIHLFGHQSDEALLLARGEQVTVFDAPWGRTGLSTCYDLRFPELYRAMVDHGAAFFLVASAWPQARLEAWRLFIRARAHENLAVLIACNCAGTNGGRTYAGNSAVIDPWGTVVAQAGSGEELLLADVDPAVVVRARAEFSALRDRVLT
jgi:predicted amidohydrolase